MSGQDDNENTLAVRVIGRPFLIVGVCSRGRNELLQRLLASMNAQIISSEVKLRLIVVDNNDEPLIPSDLFGIMTKIDFDVISEPRPGLAFARNALLDYADKVGADWIVGVDDDEWVDPDWLAAWTKAISDTTADILVGTTTLIFDEALSPIHPRQQYPLPLPNAEPRILGTCNYAVGRKIFDRTNGFGLRFRLEYNKTGGEDSEFMLRAKRAHQAVIVGCPAPKAFEERKHERGGVKYHLKRVIRNQVNAYRTIRLHKREGLLPESRPFLITMLLKSNRSFVFGMGYMVLAVLQLPFSADTGMQTMGMSLQLLARSIAIVPFLLKRQFDEYGE